MKIMSLFDSEINKNFFFFIKSRLSCDCSYRKILPVLLLGMLLCFHAINNLVVYRESFAIKRIKAGEVKAQLQKYILVNRINHIIQDRNKLEKISDLFREVVNVPSHKSRILFLIEAFGDFAFGEKYSLYIINTLYSSLFLIGVFLVGRNLFNIKIGLLAAYLTSLCPGIAWHISSWHNPDLLVSLFLIFSIYLLLCSDNFKYLFYTVLFGIISGLGILVKGSFLLYLLAPWLFFTCRALNNFNKGSSRNYRPILNLIIGFLIVFFLSSLWWSGNESIIFSRIFLYITSSNVNTQDLIICPLLLPEEPYGFLPKIIFNASLFFNALAHSTTFYLLLFFIIGICLFLINRKESRFIIYWIAFPLVILLFTYIKSARYFTPILPFMAIAASAGILSINEKRKRVFVVILVCICSFVQFLLFIYGDSQKWYKTFFTKVFNEYNSVAKDFCSFIYKDKQEINNPNVVFLSESSERKHYLLWILEDLLWKNRNEKERLSGLGGYPAMPVSRHKDNFIILVLDSKHFLNIIRNFEKGRAALQKKKYISFGKEQIFYGDWGLSGMAVNPEEFNKRIRNIIDLLYNEKNKRALEIHEKILVLEAIKREKFDLKEARRLCADIFPGLSDWFKIYNTRGIDGLIEDLPVSENEMMSLIQGTFPNNKVFVNRHIIKLYRNIVKKRLILLKVGKVPSLGLEFYLFKKKIGLDNKDIN